MKRYLFLLTVLFLIGFAFGARAADQNIAPDNTKYTADQLIDHRLQIFGDYCLAMTPEERAETLDKQTKQTIKTEKLSIWGYQDDYGLESIQQFPPGKFAKTDEGLCSGFLGAHDASSKLKDWLAQRYPTATVTDEGGGGKDDQDYRYFRVSLPDHKARDRIVFQETDMTTHIRNLHTVTLPKGVFNARQLHQ